MDGPVVKAAKAALDQNDVELILPFVPESAEEEVRSAFDKTMAARREGPVAQEVGDRYFFDTVVRLHRAGEGAPFTGVKPAGGDFGPVIPLAEEAIATGSIDNLDTFLSAQLHRQLQSRLERIRALAGGKTTAERREYTEAMLGLQVYSHHLFKNMQWNPHEAEHHSA